MQDIILLIKYSKFVKINSYKKEDCNIQSSFKYYYKTNCYTTPCANIASATLTNPAILAPLT